MTALSAPPLPDTVHQRPFRILIAEDDPAAADVLETLLGSVGYNVSVASDGDATLGMLDEGPAPDILLLDWMLPEISGLEICLRIRQRWDPLMLPILMVTAKTDAASITSAFEAGASDYLTKPFLGSELRARIAAHLRVKQLIEERTRVDEYLMEREKLSSLGLLVSGVAHDLNNPLGGISGCAQLLLEDEADAQKVDALNRILSEAQRCNRIVGDLLSFSRRHPSERSEIDVGDVLRSTMELREHQLHSTVLRTDLDVQPELPFVHGDPHQLQQVFLNILINAEHALRQGGDTLKVTAVKRPPVSRSDRRGTWLAISFFNDGPPIPPDILPRIFDPFFTTKGQEEGTGLGLAICQRIVREHGGEMDVESGADGTTFRILLPVEKAG